MAHRALGCDGVSRVDMVVSDDGNEFILEVNNLPGLSPSCMIPKIAHYCGIDYGDLVEAVLEEARLHTGVMSSPTLHAGAASADGASTDHPTPDVASAH
jgi:D-alanine-D-alanine ligase